MRSPSRPSHFMLLFVVSVGVLFLVCGELLLPAGRTGDEGGSPGIRAGSGQVASSDQKPRGGVIHPGLGDEQLDEALNHAKETSEDDPEPAPEGQDLRAARLGPWTVFGYVHIETGVTKTEKDERTTIDLQLIPLDGPQVALGRLHDRIFASHEASGSFRWEGLHPGTYRLRALPDEKSSEVLPVAIDLRLLELGNREKGGNALVFQQEVVLPPLPRPRILIGTIVGKSENPRSGMRISVSDTGSLRGSVVSDGNGEFQILRVGHGPYNFKVHDAKGNPVTWEMRNGVRADSNKVRVSLVVP